MSEIGIDISTHYPKHIDRFIDQDWDFVITVCGGANESCPMFSGKVGKRMHIGFDDPNSISVPSPFLQRVCIYEVTSIIATVICSSQSYNLNSKPVPAQSRKFILDISLALMLSTMSM